MNKRILSILLAAVMVFTMIPLTAVATDNESETLTGNVYISISDDDLILTDADDNPVAYMPIPLEELEYIVLDDWGLGDYNYDENGDGIPEITALHLYIYVHELILGYSWDDVRFSGAPGSIFFESGLFGFADANMIYNVNGEYPMVDGWGLTADQIVLTNGDFVNVAHFSFWETWADELSGLQYFTDVEGDITSTVNLVPNEETELEIDIINAGYMGTTVTPAGWQAIYYGRTYDVPEGQLCADENGKFSISFSETGTWYIWTYGRPGIRYDSEIVSSPAFATINVNDIVFDIDLTGYNGTLASGLMLADDWEDMDNSFFDETSIVPGKSTKFTFSSETHDAYIVELCTYEDDELILGWKVNGVEYFIEDNEWELENDVYIGYALDVGDNADQTAFYVDLGAADGYYTAGKWKIEPIFNDADPIEVNVTISDKGSLVVPNKTVTVTDLDHSGDFNVDEVLYAAHEEFYEGGSAAGYASADTGYGLTITKLWGDDSFCFGYLNNNDWCWSLEDAVEENDYVVAFVYQDSTYFSDAYARFEQDGYTALAETDANITLEISGYDADWNTIWLDHSGATIKVYSENFEETDSYTVNDNGDGTYAVKVKDVGDYIIVAYDNATPIVPAFGSLTVTENADLPYANDAENKISQIGEVTLESKEAIDTARAAYDSLTNTQKALVENYADLVAAEEAYVKAVENADKNKAAEVDRKISDIGTVTAHKYSKIKKAREAYDALTETQKNYVGNLSVLTSAETALAEAYKVAAKVDHKTIYEATAKYINGLGTPNVGSIGGEWMVIALTRSGYACPEGYYQNVLEFVNNNINDNEQLHRVKSTENSRIILALTAAGNDVTDVGGHNLLMGLTDLDYVKAQGINGPMWALIAFDSYDYEIPVNSNATVQTTRENLISYILEKQLADGGWALSGTVADADMTGMAMQALAPYYNTNATVKEALDKAIICLSNKQLDNGGFGSFDGSSSESCAQVIVALTALGINPETDERFVKNGVSVIDAMCLFALAEGGFEHIPDGGINGMATEQAQYALASYFRFIEGKTALYDMTDVILIKDKDAAESVEELISEIGTVTLNSKSVIESARAAYDALTDEQKKLVTNYELLIAAEDTYAELVQSEVNKDPENDMDNDDSQNSDDKNDSSEGNKKPDDSQNENTEDKIESPQTGDNSNIALWFALMLISLFALVVIAFSNKKVIKTNK